MGLYAKYNVDETTKVSEKPLALGNDGYFKLPPNLGEELEIAYPSDETFTSLEETPLNASTVSEVDDNLWAFDEHVSADIPEFKTWDLFEFPQTSHKSPSFLTEAGPSAYDAYLTTADAYKNLDPNGYCACLLALSLGRESVLFSWDSKAKAFKAASAQMKMTGYSRESLQGMTWLCIESGDATRHLGAFISKTYSTNASPSRVALANALNKMLLVVQDELGTHGLKAKSVLQLQAVVRPAHSLLTYFRKLITKFSRSTSDEALLSLIFEEAQSAEFGEEILRDAMREVLRMVSKPWTDFVEEWMGMKLEDGIRITKDGPGKSFVRVGTKMWVDDSGFELEEPDYLLDEDKMPSFVPEDVAQSIFETGRNIRFLQAYHPQHPLSHVDSRTSGTTPKLEWQYDWESVTRVEQKALAYHRVLSQVVRTEPAAGDDRGISLSRNPAASEATELHFFGTDEAQMQETVLASIARFNQPVTDIESQAGLSKMLRAQLFKSHDGNEAAGTGLDPHWSLLPLLSFGPIVSAQATIVNRECLRLLFSEHKLRQHIELQRQFQLLGNGMFSSRLANALFNPDLETAERQTGVARSGGVMGLRLTGRDNWPPASSELRLALMGILSESYVPEHGSGQTEAMSSSNHHELPGDVSFAVRDLSPEEMEKCMNPDSLEALDFLRMSYKPPPPLSPIMTPAILVKYDRIFKLLLRMLRMLFVVDQLFRDISQRTTRWHDPDNATLRFRIEAHHFVSNVTRYFFDTGIEQPWRRFEAWLSKVEKGLDSAIAEPSLTGAYSPDRLRGHHELTLDKIMLALLLRKRQQPVLKLLEDIFTVILRFAKTSVLRGQGAQGSDEEIKEMYISFRKKVELFITVCRGMSEKAGYGPKHGGNNKGDAGERPHENPILMLLLMLDISNYYTKH